MNSISDISEKCVNNDECQHIDNSVCIDNTCTCIQGYVPNSDAKSCLPSKSAYNSL